MLPVWVPLGPPEVCPRIQLDWARILWSWLWPSGTAHVVSKGTKGGHRVWFLPLAINSDKVLDLDYQLEILVSWNNPSEWKCWTGFVDWKRSNLRFCETGNDMNCSFSGIKWYGESFLAKRKMKRSFTSGIASQADSSNSVTNQPENLDWFWDYWTQTSESMLKLNNPKLWRQG